MFESLKVRAVCRQEGLDSMLNDLYVTIYHSIKEPGLERYYWNHNYRDLPNQVEKFFIDDSFKAEHLNIYNTKIQPKLAEMSLPRSVYILAAAGAMHLFPRHSESRQ